MATRIPNEKPGMEYKKLGSSDLMVSVVCLGTMTWGEQNTEEEAHAQLDLALEMGVNFIDTAEGYPVPARAETCGTTERFIGNWLEKRRCREKLIIATKVAGPGRNWIAQHRRETLGVDVDAKEVARLSGEQIKLAVNASLKRLKTTYIDLIQLHWPDRYVPLWGTSRYNPEQERPSVPFEESVAALGELIKEGKIRHWGLSNETTFGVCHFAEAAKRLGVPLPVSIQNDFSLVDRRFESELAEACAPGNYNIGLLPYGPLAGGTLTGKFLDGSKPAKARHVLFPGFQQRYHAEPTMAATRKYAELAKKHGITPTQLALAWCKSRWYVASTIIGATSVEQMREDVEAFRVTLSPDVLAAVDAIHAEARNPNILE
eukprot:tig00001368_g8409.t1